MLDLARWFPGDSELARRMRSFDWAHSALGSPETWPENLRVALGICLTSRLPMHVWWGPDLTLFYNDACVPFLGPDHHPAVLGRPGRACWAEIWHQIGPRIEEGFASGRASWSEDIQMFCARALPREEVHVTFSFSPVHGGDRVEGLFCACTETTDRIVGNRRLDTLREIGLRATRAHRVEDAVEAAARVLHRNPYDLPFAAIYLATAPGRADLRTAVGLEETRLPRAVSSTDPDDPWRLASALRDEHLLELDLRGQAVVAGPWPEPIERALVVPIRTPDRIAGLFVAGTSARRPYDAAYRGFIELVAGHIASGIADAQSCERERQRAEELAELAHARLAAGAARAESQAKDEFIAVLGHELRNPLAPIQTSLDVLAMTERPDPELLDIMARQVRHMGQLVDDLLDVARIVRGKLELRLAPVDLDTVLRRSVDLAGALIGAGGHALELQLTTSCLVRGDIDRLAQVVSILIANAAKFSPRGSRITIATRRTGDRVRIEVRDQGQGIAPEMLGRLFDPFVRAPPAVDRARGGLGLGLAIARGVVELHGGTIAASSDGVGHGSVFTIDLPAAPAVSHGAAEATASQPARRDSRVLVVDDNVQAGRALRRGLRLLGYTVETAVDGPQALSVAEQFTPDIALVDIGLPGMDGYELARRLRALRDIRLIAISGYGQLDDVERSRAAGFAEHLVKPVELRAVERAIEATAARSERA